MKLKYKNNIRSVEVKIAVGSHVRAAIQSDRNCKYYLQGTANGRLWLVHREHRGMDGVMRLNVLLGTERGQRFWNVRLGKLYFDSDGDPWNTFRSGPPLAGMGETGNWLEGPGVRWALCEAPQGSAGGGSALKPQIRVLHWQWAAFFLEDAPYYEWRMEAWRSEGLHASHPGINTSEGWPACWQAHDLFTILFRVPSPGLTSSKACSRGEQESPQGLLPPETELLGMWQLSQVFSPLPP